MVSKIGGVTALGLVVALYLAVPAVQAKTYKGTFVSTGESVDAFYNFSFDGSTTDAAQLNTGWGTDSLGDVGPGQSVSEWSTNAAVSCTFKGLSGKSETGETITLVGAVGANHSISGPLSGDLFIVGKSGTGCFNPATGDSRGTETDLFVGGTGGNKNASGSDTYTFVGVTLSAPSTPGYGFFQWGKDTGTFVEKVP